MQRLAILGTIVVILGLPIVGVLLVGRPVDGYLVFPPPLKIPTDYVKFSWLASTVVALLVFATVVPWLIRLRSATGVSTRRTVCDVRSFPRWGAYALGWTALWWALAWTRFEFFETWQRFTFFPLWLGFIVTLNALTFHRTGTCMMLRAKALWLCLFAVSAVCWWSFEWLNRFVQNWHYLNVSDFDSATYAVHATICFSTVLPAIAAVAEWLDSHLAWGALVAAGPRWRWLESPGTRVLLALGGTIAMVGAGAFPDWFYPAIWAGPLALVFAIPARIGAVTLSSEMARGDWSRAATWMTASLLCGFFWEMWNFYSLAKWIYTVPGVEKWHLFEMPLLGYSGYLPFGLECLLVAERCIGTRWRSTRCNEENEFDKAEVANGVS